MPMLSDAQRDAILREWAATEGLGERGRLAAVERRTGCSFRAVERCLDAHGLRPRRRAATAPVDAGRSPADVEAVVRRVLEAMRPAEAKPEVVELPARRFPVEPRTRVVDLGRKYERVAFLSDLHHPFQDDAAIGCALALLRDYRPQLVILGGDYFDCYSISDHDKDPGRADFLQDEFDAARPTHARIEDACAAADVVWVDGNHEERINRLQRARPGLFKLRSLELPVAAELPKRWLYYPNQTRFKLGPLAALHGDLKNRGTASMHAAAGMLRKLRMSCLFGHLHRFQSFLETNADGTVRGGFANGHLCDVSQAHYISSPDWQQGCTTVDFDWSREIFTVVPHLIIRGAHRWAGKTYAAA